MYEKVINKTIKFICDYGDVNKDELEVYSYGLELIIMYLINAGTILFLGAMIGHFAETFALVFEFALIQSFSGGYHASTHLKCFLFMLAGWVVAMFLIPLISTCRILVPILVIIGLLTIYILAPIKHINFLMSENKEQKMKKTVRVISTILALFTIVLYIFSFALELVTVTGIAFLFAALSINSAAIKEYRLKKYPSKNQFDITK